MKKLLTAAVAAAAAISCALTSVPASAQYRDRDHDGVSDHREWNRDRDRDGRLDQYDRRDDRRGERWRDRRERRWGESRWSDRRGDRREARRLRYYGGQYGYNGYRGRWRTGQRFSYYNNRNYYIDDYHAYGLPAPRHGYRYYRDSNGDIVMAAIATGIIGLIVGGALSGGDDYYRRGY